MRIKQTFLTFVASISLLSAATLYAQVTGATVSGTVKDPSGAAIPHATVVIRSLATNAERTTESTGAGLYTVTNVPAGIYRVTISAPGFTTGVISNVELTVGGARVVDGSLAVGALSNTVEVTTVPADVEVDTSIVSATVGQQRIVDLPLNGRDWTQLATLQPGVNFVRSQPGTGGAAGANRGSRGYGTQITANGHSPYENTYRLDGINENDYSNGSPGSPLGVNLGVDAIQEFSVITTAYTAEYGRTSGAVINAITRSGTNQLHGSAYVFDRDSIFDARNYFDPTTGIPTLHREQFGASLGAPIRKDKTFAFFNYEGVRQSAGLPNINVVPTALARTGTVHTAIGTLEQVAVNPTVAQYLNLYPLPNYGTVAAGSDTGLYQYVANTTIAENFLVARFDQILSKKDTLSATYLRDNAPEVSPDSVGDTTFIFNAGRQVASLTENHLFSPNVLNVARLGFNRSLGSVDLPGTALNPTAGNATIGFLPGLYAPRLTVTGLAVVGGLGSQYAVATAQDSVQFNDDVSISRGRNTLKFGFAFERLNDITHAILGTGNATFVTTSVAGTALANLLQARPYAAQVLPTGITTSIEPIDTLLAGYVQDDLHLSNRLTLNLGLRYEFLTLPYDKHNNAGQVNTLTAPVGSAPCPSAISATSSPGCTVPISNFFQTNPTRNDFEPRVGFAFNPFAGGTTAIRGAFGIYDELPLPYTYGAYSAIAAPYAQDVVLVGTVPLGSFPFGLAAVAAANPGNRIGRYVDPNPKRDYSINYNLNVEQQFGKHFSTLIGYTGSHSIHTPFAVSELDQVAPSQVQVIGGRYFWPLAGGVKQDVNAATIFGELFDGSGHYNGLLTQLKASQYHGLTMQATYTWSQCIDYGSSGTTPINYQNSLPGLISFDKPQRKGVCDFNQAQNFSANVLYELPSPKSNELLKTFGGGYQVGAIVYASTGIPFTLVDNGDVLGQKGTTFAAFPDFVPNCSPYNRGFKSNGNAYINSNCFVFPTVAAGSALAAICNQGGLAPVNGQVLCLNEQGNERRNQLIGPKIVDTDLSLIKNTRVPRISETFNFQLRVEAFNVFNHANFQAPSNNLTLGARNATQANFNAETLGTAGILTSTATTSRQIQLGAKFIF